MPPRGDSAAGAAALALMTAIGTQGADATVPMLDAGSVTQVSARTAQTQSAVAEASERHIAETRPAVTQASVSCGAEIQPAVTQGSELRAAKTHAAVTQAKKLHTGRRPAARTGGETRERQTRARLCSKAEFERRRLVARDLLLTQPNLGHRDIARRAGVSASTVDRLARRLTRGGAFDTRTGQTR